MQACVFMGVCIFGTRPAVSKEGKLPSVAFSPPVSFRNTKGHILVPACLLIAFPALIYKSALPSSCHRLLCLSAPGAATTQHNFPLPAPKQSGRFWDGHATKARPLRHLLQDFAAGTSREEHPHPCRGGMGGWAERSRAGRKAQEGPRSSVALISRAT